MNKTLWTMYFLRLVGAVMVLSAACWWAQGAVEKLRQMVP